jgi:hypothetical protein
LEDKWLGREELLKLNIVGICHKHAICIDGSWTEFGNDDERLSKGSVLGLGIIHQPNAKMECFATRDGKFIGKNLKNICKI